MLNVYIKLWISFVVLCICGLASWRSIWYQQHEETHNRIRQSYQLSSRISLFSKEIFAALSALLFLLNDIMFVVDWEAVDDFQMTIISCFEATIPSILVACAIAWSQYYDIRAKSNQINQILWVLVYLFVLVYSLLQLTCLDDQSHYEVCAMEGPEKLISYLSIATSISIIVLYIVSLRSVPRTIPSEPTLEFTQGLFGFLTFSHMNGTINLGKVKPSFEISDVPPLFHDDQCKVLFDLADFSSIQHNPASSLLRSIWRCIYREYLQQMMCQFCGSTLGYAAPIALMRLLQYTASVDSVDSSSTTDSEAKDDSPALTGVLGVLQPYSPFLAVAILFIGPALKCLCDGQNYIKGRRMAVRTRAVIISMLYKAALRVDLTSVTEGNGTLNNLISVDVREIAEWVCYSGFLWCTLLEISLALLLLYQVVGVSCLAGVGVMTLTIPLAAGASKFLDHYQTEMLKKKDERMSIMSEVLSGIRIMKWFSWEDNFRKKICNVREQELSTLRYYMFSNSFLQICWGIIPTLVGVCTFLLHTKVLGKPLTPAAGFTALVLFNSLRRPMEIFPDMVNFSIRCRVSYQRIIKFLSSAVVAGLPPNSEKSTRNQSPRNSARSEMKFSCDRPLVIAIDNATFAWNAVRKAADETKPIKFTPQFTGCCAGDNSVADIKSATTLPPNSTKNIKKTTIAKLWSAILHRLGIRARGLSKSDYEQLDTTTHAEGNSNGIELTESTSHRNPMFSIDDVDDDDEDVEVEISFRDNLLPGNHRDAPDEDLATKEVTVLTNVNLQIRQGDLVAVVGSTGSGKSTLVAGILGECKRKQGIITFASRDSSISYVTQTSWIQNASIKENIVFGRHYDEDRYRKVLFACALEADLKQFPAGDSTDIGEKGVNLSGGQQQRVSLARAAYSDSDIIILDDPLSAVDAHVGDHIFRELICNFLVGRTRILVTHQISLVVPESDLVVCMDGNGGIAAATTPELLADTLSLYLSNSTASSPQQSGELAKISRIPISNFRAQDEEEVQVCRGTGFIELLITISKEFQAAKAFGSGVREISRASSGGEHGIATSSNADLSSKSAATSETDKLVQLEEKSAGSVGFPVYWFYLKACGGIAAVIMLIAADILLPVSLFCQSYSLAKWLNGLERSVSESRLNYLLVVYLFAVGFVVICTLFKQLFQVIATLRASKELHDSMLSSVLGATVSWHDSQPSGRKTNRFSQDIGEVDTYVMLHFQDFFDCFLGTVQVLVIVTFLIPALVPCLLPVMLYDYYVASNFIVASRELKRLESVNRSPVFVLFSETLNGISVIRAFREEARFFDTCCKLVDCMNQCHFYMWSCGRWLNLRTQFMGAIVTGLVALVVVLQARSIGSTIAGLTMVYALSFTDSVTFLARMHAECQMSLNSVERIMEYLAVDQERYIPDPAQPIPPPVLATSTDDSQEDDSPGSPGQDSSFESSLQRPLDDGDESNSNQQMISADVALKRRPSWEGPGPSLISIPRNWPLSGEIEFDNISLRYRPNTPLVLKRISFTIHSGLKVGVCGRSGAGKSSLLTALFRTVEPESGRLLIDGVNVLGIPLKSLRRCIAIVPQDPVLFQGTVRSNLDPFDEVEDCAIWNALRKVHMASHVAAMHGGSGLEEGSLDEKLVGEKGGNFSVGQRQLLCMARAILRNAKILILDEATASVDAETDALIQDTVRTEFNNVTVLSIAHRLNTIAFYDKVMVVNKGCVGEYDEPLTLLKDSQSIFHGMCQRSGEFDAIWNAATTASEARHRQSS